LAMFHLAVVLESGDVVGGGLDTQDEAKFVVDLDRGLTETMLDAGALDPRRELAANESAFRRLARYRFARRREPAHLFRYGIALPSVSD
jgi:hypothetical protein